MAGDFLAVQWLTLNISTAGSAGSSLRGELRFRKLLGTAKKTFFN